MKLFTSGNYLLYKHILTSELISVYYIININHYVVVMSLLRCQYMIHMSSLLKIDHFYKSNVKICLLWLFSLTFQSDHILLKETPRLFLDRESHLA